jgi:hypothetical protein
MSDLEQLLKNLNYKAKSQDIGLASWKGSHGNPQKMFIPNKDYLLNSASRQQDEIKKRNDMMQDYLEEQKTPVTIINPETGRPEQFKYHNIPPPELFYNNTDVMIYTRNGIEKITLNADEMANYLEQIPEISEKQIKEFNGIRETLAEEKNEIEEAYKYQKLQIKADVDQMAREFQNRIKNIRKMPQDSAREAIDELSLEFSERKKGFKEFKENLDNEYLQSMNEINRRLTDLNHFEQNFFTDLQENKEKIQNELKKNEKKVEEYAKELSNLNRGELNTSKNFDETDEEYVARLQEMASEPFADARSEERAFIREKEKLRENLKLIIRDNAKIGQVTNFLYSENPQLIYEINKFFPGFKDYFIKKYGENNEKINYRDVVSEISLYLQRSTDPNVLRGGLPEQQQLIIREPVRRPSSVPEARPSGNMDSDSEEEEVPLYSMYAEKPVTESLNPLLVEDKLPEGVFCEPLTDYQGNVTTLKFTKGDKKIYIKLHNVSKKAGEPNYKFYISKTGNPNTFLVDKFESLKSKLKGFFDITAQDVVRMFEVPNYQSVKKENLIKLLSEFNLTETEEAPKKIGETTGYGIKHAQDIPEKVKFGSNILLLKKLFLKNILSIQNKHNTKINGFNNIHVSDNFVKIIMDLLKGQNFTNSQLQNLSSAERILLDHLLMLSELNKNFVTGSSTTSLNQLKKDYEILVGEIEAGNNNEMLKKKLYNLLMKMVHFGALSQIQALKHYKEIVKSYF